MKIKLKVTVTIEYETDTDWYGGKTLTPKEMAEADFDNDAYPDGAIKAIEKVSVIS